MKLNRQKYNAGPQYVSAHSSDEKPRILPEKNDIVNTNIERKKQINACFPAGQMFFILMMSILLNCNCKNIWKPAGKALLMFTT